MRKYVGSLLLLALSFQAFAGNETGSAYQIMRVPSAGGRFQGGSIDISQSAAVGSTVLGKANGGWGQSISSSTGVPSLSGGTLTFNAQLPLSLGGLGIASGTSGGIPYFASSSTVASSAALTVSQLMIGGGAGAAPTSLAAGTNGQRLWMLSGVPTYSFTPATTKTTTYTATTSDYLISASGSAFTITLPAASNSGQILVIRKTDSSFSNIITIARAGSDTIDGATSTTLNSQYETLMLQADGGTNWAIIQRQYPSTWTSYSPSLSGFGTTSSNVFNWQRVSGGMRIKGSWTNGNVTASQANFDLPSGLTVASISGSTSVCGWIADGTAGTAFINQTVLCVNGASVLEFAIQNASAAGLVGNQQGQVVAGNNHPMNVDAFVPITGWN